MASACMHTWPGLVPTATCSIQVQALRTLCNNGFLAVSCYESRCDGETEGSFSWRARTCGATADTFDCGLDEAERDIVTIL
jgi:hypothetical protein